MQQAQLDTANVSRTSIAIVAVMMVGSFVSILNQNLMTTAIPSLMVVFDVPSSTAQWLTTAFMLANGIMIPVTAFLLRRFSTRALFFLAMGLFGAGTALCAVAFSFEMLLAGRVVQALGAGITMPLMQTVLFVVFPPDKRGTAMGFFGLVIAFAPAIGPTLSGWIVDFFPWQALFLLLLPIIALDLVVAFFVVKNVTERSNPAFDLLSVVLSSVGFGGLLYGLSVAGTLGWTNPEVLIVLAVAVCAVVWFIVRQLHLETPMLEFRVFKYRTFTVSLLLVVLAWASFMGASTMLPMYMQNAAGFSALTSGMTLMAGGIVMGVLSPINGRVFDRFGARAGAGGPRARGGRHTHVGAGGCGNGAAVHRSGLRAAHGGPVDGIHAADHRGAQQPAHGDDSARHGHEQHDALHRGRAGHGGVRGHHGRRHLVGCGRGRRERPVRRRGRRFLDDGRTQRGGLRRLARRPAQARTAPGTGRGASTRQRGACVIGFGSSR